MKMAFPGAKNMNEALQKMQQMTQGFGGKAPRGGAGAGAMDAQLKAAMDMLKQVQQKGKKR